MSLDHFPDEIVQQVLYNVSPEDNLRNFQLVSHRYKRIANEPVLWKHYCRYAFRFWDPHHDLHKVQSMRASEVEWKAIFLARKRLNAEASTLLEKILETKVGRVKRTEQIVKMGYDVKDFLVQQCQVGDSVEDALARRYYSKSILDSLHRSTAIDNWDTIMKMGNSNGQEYAPMHLETLIASFDLFVLQDQEGDVDEICWTLDLKAAEFMLETEGYLEMTMRQRALALVRWLRRKNLTGLNQPETSYRNLRNCLIGQALYHPDHDSIPIISSVIFCCIASRVGLSAECCSFPNHVHAIVFAEENETLDSLPAGENEPEETMYLDPYGSDDEITSDALMESLRQFGWHANPAPLLAPVSPISIGLRTARNIRASVARAEVREQDNMELSRLVSGHPALSMNSALYASLWASLVLTPTDVFDWDENLEMFLRCFAKNWHEDAWLVEKYLVPLFDEFSALRQGLGRPQIRGFDDPREIVGLVRELDDATPPVFRRTGTEAQPVAYKIGQVFRHRRYGWIGVINGWTDQGTRRLPMPHTLAIDETLDDSSDTDLPSLVRPRNQTFYTCLRTTGIERHVVAEDNVVILRDSAQVPNDLFDLAGKFFKRFDASSCTFVSNLKEEYPDD